MLGDGTARVPGPSPRGRASGKPRHPVEPPGVGYWKAALPRRTPEMWLRESDVRGSDRVMHEHQRSGAGVRQAQRKCETSVYIRHDTARQRALLLHKHGLVDRHHLANQDHRCFREPTLLGRDLDVSDRQGAPQVRSHWRHHDRIEPTLGEQIILHD